VVDDSGPLASAVLEALEAAAKDSPGTQVGLSSVARGSLTVGSLLLFES
jgi:hypothetical protein